MDGHAQTDGRDGGVRCDVCGKHAAPYILHLRGCFYCTACAPRVYDHITTDDRGGAVRPHTTRKRNLL